MISGFRGSGNRVRRATSTEWSVNVIEGGQLRPVSGVEVVNLVLVEDKATGVGVQTDRLTPIAAGATSAFGVTPIVALNEMDLNRWPYDAMVEAGFPATAIWASPPGEPPVDDIEL